MSDMSMDAMRSLKSAALSKTLELAAMNAAIHRRVDSVKRDLLQLKGGGFSPNRIDSTLMLANEILREQENQHRRLLSFSEGVGNL